MISGATFGTQTVARRGSLGASQEVPSFVLPTHEPYIDPLHGVVQDYIDPLSFCSTDGVVDKEKTEVVLHCTVLYCTVRHCTHCTVRYCTHCTVLYSTRLHCIALHCIVLYSALLYSTVRHYAEMRVLSADS